MRLRLTLCCYFAAALPLQGAQAGQAQDQPSAPVRVTLAQAVQQAMRNEPNFAASLAAQKSARIDSYLAKAALLPSVSYHNQLLYTQPNGQLNQGGQVGAQAAPIFIANNAVHEYASQAVINETIGLKQLADAQAAEADAARTTAELEIARRGLLSAVVTLYYAVAAARQKVNLQGQALQEAQTFVSLTGKREAAREVAHADTVKAELQMQQKKRDLMDAQVEAEKSSLELGVLLFADPRIAYDTDAPPPAHDLPTRDEVEQIASKSSPELRAAFAELAAANAGVKSAKAAYLPDLGLNFTYGIDAPQFATRGPDRVRNLGYSLSGTVDIPVWDWLSTQKRIKQSEIQRDATQVRLTAAQRRLLADIQGRYTEADAARNELQLLDDSVRTAAESLELTKLRYAAGESSALEIVDAQNSLLSAQVASADGVVRFGTALANLQLLIGSF